jgi:uroporphyrinogen-III synthase
LRVLNTRPEPQNQPLSQEIINAGHSVINLPTLGINATPLIWLNNMPDLSQIKCAIFTSSNAVKYYFDALIQHNIAWIFDICVIAIGEATARTLSQYHIPTNFIPTTANSESLLTLSCFNNIAHQNILLIKGTTGRELITTTLQQKKANLITLKVYQTFLPKYNAQDLHDLWFKQSIDLILYTSQQGMQNLFTLLGKDAHNWLCATPSIVISQRLRQVALNIGIKNIKVCEYNKILEIMHQ